MRYSFALSVISLAFGLVCPTTAHLLQRQAAGSESTTTSSSVPAEILTAPASSVTQTTSLPSASAISTLESSATATATATDSASASTTTTSVDECNNPGGEYAPFCKPTNGSTLDFGTTYTVTWDTSYFNANATVVIEIEYASTSSQQNTSVYSTGELENEVGYASISPKKSWLGDSSSANLTFYFSVISADGTDDNSATTMTGPTVSLGSQASSSTTQSSGSLLDSSSSSSSSGSSSNLGMVTGLTIGFAFLALFLVSGIFVWYRRYMIRNRGYGVGKSRNQRLQERQRHPSWHGSGTGGFGQQSYGNVKLGEMQSA